MPKNWRKLTSERVADRNLKIFSLRLDQYESPRTGQPLTATVLEAHDWVNVIALTPTWECVLIKQFRFGNEQITLEIPGGMVDPGEQPLAAAERELREETGYRAQRWTALGRVSPNPAFQSNSLHMFLAEGCVLEGEQIPDPGEDIEVTLTPLSQIRSMIADTSIDHALVLVAFLKLQQHVTF